MKPSVFISAATCAAVAVHSISNRFRNPNTTPNLRLLLDIIGITYHGPAHPGGPNHTLHGTVEQIYSQILTLNPSFNPGDFAETSSSFLESYKQELFHPVTGKLRKRSTHLNCNPQGESYRLSKTPEPLNTLYKMPGLCGAPKGWGGVVG